MGYPFSRLTVADISIRPNDGRELVAMTYAEPLQRPYLISGLRALADLLESNPEIPAPMQLRCWFSRRTAPTRMAVPKSTA